MRQLPRLWWLRIYLALIYFGAGALLAWALGMD